jgi:chemotaxis protein MotB
MAKKHHEDEHTGNHERWLLTYADLITLLMIFFVVMYSMSQVDKAKFDSIAAQLSIVMGGGSVITPQESGPNGILKDIPIPSKSEMDIAQEKLEEYIAENGLSDLARVYRDERGLIVSLNEGLLFNSGSAELDKDSQVVLVKITNAIKGLPNYVRVEGFTDNVPIKTAQFASNWELASQRAINVSKLMISDGLVPERLSNVSYGEYRPLFPNDSNDHRKLNRRVDIIVINQQNDTMEPKAQEDQKNIVDEHNTNVHKKAGNE